MPIKKTFYLFFSGLLFCVVIYAEDIKSPPPVSLSPVLAGKENDYDDAVVLLIDAKSGMIGLSWLNEATNKEEKISFKIDTDKVDVTNSMNQFLEFSNISVGDHVSITAFVGPDGKETVENIVDYNAVDPDA